MSYCYDKGIPHSVFLEWNPDDKAKTIAYALESSARCTMCGTAPWEWEENKYAYTAIDELCHGCYQKSAFTDQESRSLPGTNVKLVPMTPVRKAELTVRERKRRRMRE